MKGFRYNGVSSENIIGTPLLLCTFSSISSVIGSNRLNYAGNLTITKLIVNEYGMTSDPLVFNYSLIKSDLSEFTEEELIKVEEWLTSTDKSKPLDLFDCDTKNTYRYYGKFISTEWQIGGVGYAGVSFEFGCTTAYPVGTFEKKYRINSQSITEEEIESGNYEVDDVKYNDGKTIITINNPVRLSNDFIYPILKYKTDNIPNSELNENNRISFEIANSKEKSRTMKCETLSGVNTVLDCERCIPYSVNDADIISEYYSYKDLGWVDVGDIYWLRLFPGENVLTVTGKGELTIKFEYPIKRAGGWL